MDESNNLNVSDVLDGNWMLDEDELSNTTDNGNTESFDAKNTMFQQSAASNRSEKTTYTNKYGANVTMLDEPRNIEGMRTTPRMPPSSENSDVVLLNYIPPSYASSSSQNHYNYTDASYNNTSVQYQQVPNATTFSNMTKNVGSEQSSLTQLQGNDHKKSSTFSSTFPFNFENVHMPAGYKNTLDACQLLNPKFDPLHISNVFLPYSSLHLDKSNNYTYQSVDLPVNSLDKQQNDVETTTNCQDGSNGNGRGDGNSYSEKARNIEDAETERSGLEGHQEELTKTKKKTSCSEGNDEPTDSNRRESSGKGKVPETIAATRRAMNAGNEILWKHVMTEETANNMASDAGDSRGGDDEDAKQRGMDEETAAGDDGVEEEGRREGIEGGGEGGVVIGSIGAASCGAGGVGSSATSNTGGKSQLEELLERPVQRIEYPYASQQSFVSTNNVKYLAVGAAANMQFYQPPPQHLGRTTPPPSFAQPYAMTMRPHEEETRQIMNLDNQQTHNSSPTSSWNQPYAQMTNMTAYPPRGAPIYAGPMSHQLPPPGVPTSNPYYPPPPHHMAQAAMIPPGMHAQQQQQQQPYYNTQSPLTGTPPSINYNSSGIPAPPTNGNGPIFNFSKPRPEGSTSNVSTQRRKKNNDMSSPRFSDDSDQSSFPDMNDFPLLDVVQSKAKKDAGRKPCRPHLCEQSRMLISRVCHFQREFIKRLGPRHPLSGTPFAKPDQWTSQMMGISLATVRKCVDMAVDEEVFTRCTDKNLVNLTPSERTEREELLSKLSHVFEDEKSLGAGTAGLTIAEYSPRRSYSTSLVRQSTDEKSCSSYINGNDYGSGETTLLNLDDHSNSSKDFATPTPNIEMSATPEMGAIIPGITKEDVTESSKESPSAPPKEVNKVRGRPKKPPGSAVKPRKRNNNVAGASNETQETIEDKEEIEKKTEDENESAVENESKLVIDEDEENEVEREEDAASSEGTARSETATPEPTASTKTRNAKKKRLNSGEEEYNVTAGKRRRGVVNGLVAAANEDEHKMVTRARSRQP